MRTPRRLRRAGFTLIEILVAVIILGICIVGLLPLLVVATGAHQTSHENAAAETLATAVSAQLQESMYASGLRGGAKPGIWPTPEGFSSQYTITVTFSDLSPPDPTGLGVLATIRIRRLPDGVRDDASSQDIGRTWIFHTVVLRKSDHRHLSESEPPRVRVSPASSSKSQTAHTQWLGEVISKLPDIDFKPPDEMQLLRVILEVGSARPPTMVGTWETVLAKKTSKGAAVFQQQPVQKGKAANGRIAYSMNGVMTFVPYRDSGLKNPRVIQIVKREAYVDGQLSDMNSHPFMIDGPRSPEDPSYRNQKQIARPKEVEYEGLAEQGVRSWDAPGLNEPWSTVRNVPLRIVWTVYAWVLATQADGSETPLGYFSWSVVVEGRVGSGPLDTELKPKTGMVTFIEADGKTGQGADHVLQKALRK